jgi:hypothetical protein
MSVVLGIGFALNIGFRPQFRRLQAVERRRINIIIIYERIA